MVSFTEQSAASGEAAGAAARRIFLAGTANVGKSSLFSVLTKRFAMISNYPGTTVEVTEAEHEGALWIDTPGIYGLVPASEEEAVTVKMLLESEGGTVLLVVDARNLGRGIALFLALSEFKHRFVIALNMIDEAKDAGFDIDTAALELILGVPVVPTVAVTRQGIAKLKARLANASFPAMRIPEPESIESAVAEAEPLVSSRTHARTRARLALAGFTDGLDASTVEKCAEIRRRYLTAFSAGFAARFAESRNDLARLIADAVSVRRKGSPKPLARMLGNAAMHPVWGWPILALVLYLSYQIVGAFAAGVVVDVVESTLFEGHLLPWFSSLLAMLPDGALKTLLLAPGEGSGTGLLVGEFGLISMGLTYAIAIVLPVVFFFFLLFSVMEDTGYLPRLTVMLDGFFRRMGLNGRAVLPMILGLGCDTMAVMTTRILPTKKERLIVTFLLALAVPCSAQMGVLAGLTASLSAKAVLVWLGALVVVVFAAGWLGSRILPGSPEPLIFEIPPIRVPKLANVLAKTLARSEWYLKEAVPLFIVGTFILWTMDALDLLVTLEHALSPVVVGILGLPEGAARAFLMGFLRRDYGAAGLYDLFGSAVESGSCPPDVEAQIIVSIVTITLFIPCIANFLVIAKEQGAKIALAIAVLTTTIAVAVGGATRLFLAAVGWS